MKWINSLVCCLLFSFLAAAAPSLATARTAYVTGFVGGGGPIITKVTSASPGDPGSYAAPIDLDGETYGTEIPLEGGGSPWGIAITPDGSRALVADTGEDRIVPIDTETNSAGTPIAVGNFPVAVAVTPDGTRAYAVNAWSESITPIDLGSGSAEPAIAMSSEPTDIAIAPDGTRAYVTIGPDDAVVEVDLAAGVVVDTIPVGDFPTGVAVTPDGTRAYVANLGEGTVTPVDLSSNSAGAPITTVPWSEAMAITPDGTRAYVIGFDSPLVELDLTTNTVAAEIPFGGDVLFGVATRPDGARAYVTDYDSEELATIDVPTGALADTLSIGKQPEAIAIVPNQGPVAAFEASPTSAAQGEAVDFDASGSSDSDGSVARYDWDFGDGETLPDGGASPSHAYAEEGSYTVTLTVTDGEGCSTTIVFTGQTAHCNGSPAAQATHAVTVSEPVPPEESGDVEDPAGGAPSSEPAGAVRVTPYPEPEPRRGTPKKKRKRKPRCPTITAARTTTFAPKIVLGHMVPGVRVRVSSNRSIRLRAIGTVLWSQGGFLHRAGLGKRSKRINGWVRLRFPLPRIARSALSFKQMVNVQLRLMALPGGRRHKGCRRMFHRTVRTRVVNVFPHAVQRGKLPYRPPRSR